MYRSIIIVGAGMFGSVIAERITSLFNIPVTIIDKRCHIGGNCWSEKNSETGIECHMYGSHIFHTSNQAVWKYISQFTKWNNYQHHVWINHNNKIYSMPINLQTINSLYQSSFSPEEAKQFISYEAEKENICHPKNLKEKAISLIGRKLYEAFIRGYTIKQWEKDPEELSPEIITRLPVRFNYNNRYFDDRWEGVPCDGYGKIFERMLNNQLITVQLHTDWFKIRKTISPETLIIYTGPIDEFFDYQLGRLEWRTLDFEVEHLSINDFQGTSVMNYADSEIPYTRIHEFKHFQPEKQYVNGTIIFKEYSKKAKYDDEPYYPIGTERNIVLYKKYEQLALKNKNVLFGGRLGSYKYYDMDDAVLEAINFVYDNHKKIVG